HLRQAQGSVLGSVFSASAVVQGPGAPGVEPLGHDHEAGKDLVAVERRVRAKLSIEFRLEWLGGELGGEFSLQRLRQELAESARLEHVAAHLLLQILQRVDRHAAGEACGDDRPSRGPADQIEIVAETGLVAEPRLDQGLHGLQELEGQNPSDAAAVERENAFWRARGIEMLSLGERQSRVPPWQSPFAAPCGATKLTLRKTIRVSSADRPP